MNRHNLHGVSIVFDSLHIRAVARRRRAFRNVCVEQFDYFRERDSMLRRLLSENLENVFVVGEFAASVRKQQQAFDQSALMKQRVKQIRKTPALGECAPFEQLLERRLRAALLVKARKVVVIDLEERRRPRLEPVRAPAGLVDSSQQVENESGFASLKQTVLLVESKWDSRPPQVFANFRAVAVLRVRTKMFLAATLRGGCPSSQISIA